MTTHLLDANVLIAATVREHEHHVPATTWLGSSRRFAVCPVVEGALLRFLLRIGESSRTAAMILAALRSTERCEFWTDSLSYLDVDLSTVQGYRQLTDTYLTNLARAHDATLATFDAALAAQHPEHCVLVPS